MIVIIGFLDFHPDDADKFAALVKSQVDKMKADGSPEVAFRVALKDGKVNFTARGLKGAAHEHESAHHGVER